jgi:fatty-acyl-CoA synthase
VIPVTVDRMLRDRARTTPHRVAIEAAAGDWTYAELDRRSDELAASLDPGARVSTLTGNSAEHVAVFFACAKAGAILHPISWRLAPAEVAWQLDDAEPAILLVEDEHRELAEAAIALAQVRPRLLRPGAVSEESQRRLRDATGPKPDDPLLLIYTSGTTGKPKGALLTHANCFWTNLSFDLATGVSQHDVVLQVLPQFHCGGWNVQPLLAWWKGARVVIERGFEAARALELIETRRITTTMGVPANYLFMAQEPRFAEADLSSLRLAVVGGAPMPVALLDTWAARGVEIVQGYGLTEAAPNVLCLPPEDARRKAGFAGRPYPYVECDLSPEGELRVRGPNVFVGYWRNPEATAAAFRDGWLLTGDLAERDDEGDYRIRGRVKELVVSGGENVYPAEIEAVLHEHPDVVEAAVVGVPDERWGEVCAAFAVVSAPVTEDELRAFCQTRLARFKVPKTFTLVERLPRNSVGKVQKDELVRAVHA